VIVQFEQAMTSCEDRNFGRGPAECACVRRRERVRPQGKGREQGAVLLEVVLALVLFVAAAAIVTSGMNASMDSVERQRLNVHALDLAVTMLSEIQMGLRSAEAAGPEDFEAPFENWTWELQSTPVETEIGEASAARVEVVIRHRDAPVVYRLAQVIQPGKPLEARKESKNDRAF